MVKIYNYSPPLAWLDRHSAENGVSCAELRSREEDGDARLSMTSHGMTLADALKVMERWNKEREQGK